ncbi:MAG: hypothetical protein NVS3B20_13370 [Polyangiales bacterium]
MAHTHADTHAQNNGRGPQADSNKGGSSQNPTEIRSLDDLTHLPSARLAERYAAGTPPQLGVLAGPTHGRVLSCPLLAQLGRVGATLDQAVGLLGRQRWVPWTGKLFHSPDQPHGTSGSNRVFGRDMLHFDATLAKSAIDHAPALLMRYDRKEIPHFFHQFSAELREVGRGVYLGPLYIKAANGPMVLLWWGCVKA